MRKKQAILSRISAEPLNPPVSAGVLVQPWVGGGQRPEPAGGTWGKRMGRLGGGQARGPWGAVAGRRGLPGMVEGLGRACSQPVL